MCPASWVPIPSLLQQLTAARSREVRGTVWSEVDRDAGVWIAAVPHGFRSSFRDWAAEETDHPREVAEAALAHKVRNPIEAAYRRTDLLERRRRLMDDWARYLEGRSGEHRDLI